MRRERDIQGPESGAHGFKLTRRDFLKAALVGALAVAANKACNTFGIEIPTPRRQDLYRV